MMRGLAPFVLPCLRESRAAGSCLHAAASPAAAALPLHVLPRRRPAACRLVGFTGQGASLPLVLQPRRGPNRARGSPRAVPPPGSLDGEAASQAPPSADQGSGDADSAEDESSVSEVDNPVYLCPVCNAPFRRWRNAVRHFKSTLHWQVPEKGQRALQRMRRKSKIVS